MDRFAGSRVPSLVSFQRFSSHDVSLPSLGSRRARFPDVSGTMKTLRLPAACTRFLMVSVAGSTPPRIVRVRRGAPEECGGHSSGLGRLVSRRPYAGLFVVDASGISQVAWRSIPCLCPAPRPRPSRQVLTSSGLASAAPGSNKPKAPAGIISRGLPHGFSICRLRFTSSVAAAHARLASGWRAAPLPGGSRTLWVALKGFRLHPSSFPGLCLTQVG